MKITKNKRVIKSLAVGMAASCIFTISASAANALDVPNEVQTEMQYQAGTSYMNDTVNMRYSRDRKSIERDYQYYERRKHIDGDLDNNSEVVRDVNGNN